MTASAAPRRVPVLVAAQQLALLLLLLLPARARAAPAAPAASAAPKLALFSLAIGYNRPESKARQRLKYADDDAVRNYKLMVALGARAALLSELDRETRELHRDVQPTMPTLEAVRRRWGVDLAALNRERFAAWVEAGFVDRAGGVLRPTPRGLAVADGLAASVELGGSDVSR